MTAYKYLSKDLTSYNDFKWEIGKKYTIDVPGNKMCSKQVFHCYNNPLVAEFVYTLHLNSYTPYDLYAIEVEGFCNSDGLKYASKEQTVIKKIDRPIITVEQRVEIAIRLAKIVYKNAKWNEWADRWLSGEDRTVESADASYYDAYCVANAAAYCAANAAAAYCSSYDTYAGNTDAYYVTNAAYYAAYAAYDVEPRFNNKEELNKLLIQIIEQVISK